ncbi:MAG TPA: hypothetical protein VMX54_16625 [Vicinamibacteria bacterium]|nr:hypothetical protein [Vicinamibacteria bacterium]
MGEPMPDPEELMALLRSLPRADMSPPAARRLREAACRSLARRGQGHALRGVRSLGESCGRALEAALVAALALGFLGWTIGRALEVLRSVPGGPS